MVLQKLITNNSLQLPLPVSETDTDKYNENLIDDDDESNKQVAVSRTFSHLDELQNLLLVDLSASEESIVRCALSRIAELISPEHSNFQQNRETMRLAGAHSVLLCVMMKEAWWSRECIQSEACKALQTASCHVQQFASLAVKLGAFEAVLWAMQQFPNSADVQTYGCGALNRLASNKVNNMILFMKLHGAQMIVSSMKRFPEHNDLQHWGSWCFEYASGWQELKQPLIGAGVVGVLASAVEEFPNEDWVKEKAMVALNRLLESMRRVVLG
jgi:hypothetical protein